MQNKKRWTAREIRRLGKATDADLARAFGRTVEAVRNKRRERFIEPHRPHRTWSATDDRIVLMRRRGGMTDAMRAELLGCTVAAVRSRRKQLKHAGRQR